MFELFAEIWFGLIEFLFLQILIFFFFFFWYKKGQAFIYNFKNKNEKFTDPPQSLGFFVEGVAMADMRKVEINVRKLDLAEGCFGLFTFFVV